MSVLNLPRELRYKRENMILVSLIPGPHEPQHDINNFLVPLVDDLCKLWKGMDMEIKSIKSVKKIRCALMCVACDIPAGRKICGFLGHNARLGCSRCLKEFLGGIGSKDYSGFDRQNWERRTKIMHNNAAFKSRNLNTVTAIENEESRSGCRYSELLLLPYFDAPRMLIIDPMHNLYLGTAKYFFKNILISKGYISHTNLTSLQEKIDSFIVPSGIDKIRMKIGSGLSNLTADQWKNWVIYYSIIALNDLVSTEVLECWRLFVLGCRTMCTKIITVENIKLGDAFLLQFCKRVERLFGNDSITPNMHLHNHLRECIEDFGPVHGFWCYPYERYNGLLGATPNNNRSVEAQFMKRILQENQAFSLIPQQNPEIASCFPSMRHTGSVADTMYSSAFQKEEINSYVTSDTGIWTLDSIQHSIEFPTYKYNSVLPHELRTNFINLYCKMYSLMEFEVEIASICSSYPYVTYNGQILGTFKSRAASSSIVMTKCFNSGHESPSQAGRIINIYKHSVYIKGVIKEHLLLYMSWYERHPESSCYGKPVSIWYNNFFQTYDVIPIQMVVSRTVSLIGKFYDDTTVIFVVPCGM